MNEFHTPVLLKETLEYFITNRNGYYFDGTLGFGGHSAAILESLENGGILIATDKDKKAFDFCKDKFAGDSRVRLYKTSFTDIRIISKIEFIDIFDGIFADLGVSSFQLDDKNSGFTYRDDVPLDLRMDKSKGIPAWKLLNELEEEEIANIIYNYGEERKSRLFARKIIETRKKESFKTTGQLRKIIEGSVPSRFEGKTLSRVFQAFRIYVNNELEELENFIDRSVELLKPGGRIVFLTYHSLEDRIVKDKFKYESIDCICPPEVPICVCDKEKRLNVLTRKPIIPSAEEIKLNKRSRSAKLRAAERI
ncbi:MAG: 16S rRNA (cytosine(1402)-N(4))-methyltransferase RsmH [Melioribacteraceae bacterium]|nr:16S rRNA (cytosine(1402)-N(4))-methyltransferase RsmH [Melioribacteraceae bacterium]